MPHIRNEFALGTTCFLTKMHPQLDHWIDVVGFSTGFRHQKEFILTQHPLPKTVLDFWQMLWENRVTTVACLTSEVRSTATGGEISGPQRHSDYSVQIREESRCRARVQNHSATPVFPRFTLISKSLKSLLGIRDWYFIGAISITFRFILICLLNQSPFGLFKQI